MFGYCLQILIVFEKLHGVPCWYLNDSHSCLAFLLRNFSWRAKGKVVATVAATEGILVRKYSCYRTLQYCCIMLFFFLLIFRQLFHIAMSRRARVKTLPLFDKQHGERTSAANFLQLTYDIRSEISHQAV